MKKWHILENILVEKLVFWGKGFAKLATDNEEENWKTLFIIWWPIPWSYVDLKITKKRRDYYETQIVSVVKKSPLEKKHPHNPYGESGWHKWVNIPYENQLEIKQQQVEESIFHIKKIQKDIEIQRIIPSPKVDGYRNKIEFSFWKFISAKYDVEEHFNVWFHKQGEFSKIVDTDWCVLIDDIQNQIYIAIKNYCKTLGLPVYDQKTQQGFFRHIIIRRAFFTDQVMIIFSFNDSYLEWKEQHNWKIELLRSFFYKLARDFPIIKSIYFSYNDNKADIAIGKLECIYGEKTITEILHKINFSISPTSFFQTNSYWAEILYKHVLQLANPEKLKEQKVLDLYGGTGTIGMIFAKSGAKSVISVELVPSASSDGEKNTKENNITNIEFVCDKVENFLQKYISEWWNADLLIIDPPRAWMHPKALPNILEFQTNQIIYVSCNPATLSRDLDYILKNSKYSIETIIPVDMFPHTHHIEIIVSLKLQ